MLNPNRILLMPDYWPLRRTRYGQRQDLSSETPREDKNSCAKYKYWSLVSRLAYAEKIVAIVFCSSAGAKNWLELSWDDSASPADYSGKPFLRNFYHECCLSIAQFLPNHIDGPVIELGSGAEFMKEYIPNLLTSDIIKIPDVDLILDGTNLPFSTNTLRGIVMIDVFHHIPNAASIFSDAVVCIKPGGVIIIIEPWSTPWSHFVYRHLHHEPFELDVKEWKLPTGGPLSQATIQHYLESSSNVTGKSLKKGSPSFKYRRLC